MYRTLKNQPICEPANPRLVRNVIKAADTVREILSALDRDDLTVVLVEYATLVDIFVYRGSTDVMCVIATYPLESAEGYPGFRVWRRAQDGSPVEVLASNDVRDVAVWIGLEM